MSCGRKIAKFDTSHGRFGGPTGHRNRFRVDDPERSGWSNRACDVSNFMVFGEECSCGIDTGSNCSLLKPQKYVARRSNKENQSISTITNDGGPGGGGSGNGSGRHLNSQQQALNPGGSGGGGQGIYDNSRHTQVKTYMDHGNGHGIRTVGSSHYSKVRRFVFSFLSLLSSVK